MSFQPIYSTEPNICSLVPLIKMVPVYFHSLRTCSDLILIICYQVQGPFIVTFMHRNLPLDRFHLKKEKEPGRK